ncbi:AraC family ligand binding domain-containing protein [Vibrio sp. SCSIO 43137]|uniref:AraC family ligand binding domain-containing protein n=1 Tax=Vibrio sp. SCSIO 43137 TaxID=3021011 RepID=UPI002308204A|nr:AraC family ligand binding domain-containing protein [Vibrio sp. SCSIO 43137]WCE31887.1 AraC family ligand binding domain-containing protein [Vibrio sp. SCSIO 43137]
MKMEFHILANTVRDIDQRFWSSKAVSHLTIRSTHNSIQGYKAHSHPELSIGIIESGATQTFVDGRHIVLGEGDIVLIEPDLVHACNPVEGKPRSYHMLYVDNTWCCNLLSRLYGYQVTQFICEQRVVSEAECGLRLSTLIGLLSGLESKK